MVGLVPLLLLIWFDRSHAHALSGLKLLLRRPSGRLHGDAKAAENTSDTGEQTHSDESTAQLSKFELEVFRHTRNQNRPVCRIHHACVFANGTFHLHPSLRKYVRELAECSVVNPLFMESSHVQLSTTAAAVEVDLFGVRPAPPHMPHFLTDLLPLLFAAELLEPTFTDPAEIHRKCVTGSKTGCGFKSHAEPLKTGIYVDDRVASLKPSAWVPTLVSMIPGDVQMIFPQTLFPIESMHSCLRSVIAYTPNNSAREGDDWFGDKHRLFAENRLSRKSAIATRTFFSQGKCAPRVTIVNRKGWLRKNGRLLGRDISNLDKLLAKIIDMQRSSPFKDTMRVNVSVVYFEETDLHYQATEIQRADLILGVHGASLANLLFARADTPVLEVFPFAYRAGPFDRLARDLRLRYEYTTAEPDSKSFLHCIEETAAKRKDPHLAATARTIWAQTLAAQDKRRNLFGMVGYNVSAEYTGVFHSCLRAQRLEINIEKTASRILELASMLCKEVALKT